MTSVINYREASQEYLEHARKALEEDDYPQGSEKLWGAAAEMVKAVAESRGWQHNGHALLFTVVNRLADETGDDDLTLLFRAASGFHINFYERWLPPDDVKRAVGEMERLIDKLQGSLEVPA